MANNNTNRAAVYAGTYGLYNSGSLFGKWFYFDEYESREEMLESIESYFKGIDDDPEIMYQDFDNFPRALYSECSISDELFDFCKYTETCDDVDAAIAYVECFNDWNESDFEDSYIGWFSDNEDLARYFIEDLGSLDIPSEVEPYFDYEAYGRDLAFDLYEMDGYYFYNC